MVTPNYCFNYTKGKVVVVEGQGGARRVEEGLLISRLTFNIAAPLRSATVNQLGYWNSLIFFGTGNDRH